MFEYALRNIWQRKTRSILTVLGITASITLYITISTISNWYDSDLQKQLSTMAGKVIVMAKTESGVAVLTADSMLPEPDADAVLGLDGIDRAASSPLLFHSLVGNQVPNMPPTVQAVGIRPGHEAAFLTGAGVTGAPSLAGPDDVILGAKAAEHYGKTVGDELTIQDHTFRVTGVLAKGHEFLNSAVVMNLKTAQTVFVRPGVVTSVYITARSPEQIKEIAETVGERFPKLQAITQDELARNAEQALAAAKGFFSTIKTTTIFVSLVVISIVMVMAVGERKKELGTLKALGARSWHILASIAGEAVVLSLAGGLLAIPLAWAQSSDDAAVDLTLALQTVAVAALVGALAALWPAVNALRVDPLESLRHE